MNLLQIGLTLSLILDVTAGVCNMLAAPTCVFKQYNLLQWSESQAISAFFSPSLGSCLLKCLLTVNCGSMVFDAEKLTCTLTDHILGGDICPTFIGLVPDAAKSTTFVSDKVKTLASMLACVQITHVIYVGELSRYTARTQPAICYV